MRTTVTLDDLQTIAAENGGECLSHEYVGNQVKLSWRCGRGHEWEATPASIRQGSWCPVCSGRQPLTMDDMHAAAENRGGRCLSTEFLGVRTPLLWQCAKGHQWRAKPQIIRQGTWCPRCLDPAPDAGIARVSRMARDRGGLCLSAQHHDPNKRLRWRCAKGHEWRAKEDEVVAGRWCPKCE